MRYLSQNRTQLKTGVKRKNLSYHGPDSILHRRVYQKYFKLQAKRPFRARFAKDRDRGDSQLRQEAPALTLGPSRAKGRRARMKRQPIKGGRSGANQEARSTCVHPFSYVWRNKEGSSSLRSFAGSQPKRSCYCAPPYR